MNVATGVIRVCARDMRHEKSSPDFSFDATIEVDNFQCLLRSSGKVADFEINKRGLALLRKIARPRVKTANFQVEHHASGVFEISKEDARVLVHKALKNDIDRMDDRMAELEMRIKLAQADLDGIKAERPGYMQKLEESANNTLSYIAKCDKIIVS